MCKSGTSQRLCCGSKSGIRWYFYPPDPGFSGSWIKHNGLKILNFFVSLIDSNLMLHLWNLWLQKNASTKILCQLTKIFFCTWSHRIQHNDFWKFSKSICVYDTVTEREYHCKSICLYDTVTDREYHCKSICLYDTVTEREHYCKSSCVTNFVSEREHYCKSICVSDTKMEKKHLSYIYLFLFCRLLKDNPVRWWDFYIFCIRLIAFKFMSHVFIVYFNKHLWQSINLSFTLSFY